MHIAEQIIDIIPMWFHLFIQDGGAYTHKNTGIVSLHMFFFPGKILTTTIYPLW